MVPNHMLFQPLAELLNEGSERRARTHAGIWSNCPSDRTDRLVLRHVRGAQKNNKVCICVDLIQPNRSVKRDIPQQVWNMFITPYAIFVCIHYLSLLSLHLHTTKGEYLKFHVV